MVARYDGAKLPGSTTDTCVGTTIVVVVVFAAMDVVDATEDVVDDTTEAPPDAVVVVAAAADGEELAIVVNAAFFVRVPEEAPSVVDSPPHDASRPTQTIDATKKYFFIPFTLQTTPC